MPPLLVKRGSPTVRNGRLETDIVQHRAIGAFGSIAKMRKFALYNLSVLLILFLATAVEASVQTEPVAPRPLCPPLDSSMQGETAPDGNADLGTSATFCSLGMPRLMIDACVGCVALGHRGPITLCDLAEAAGLKRQTLPEPATIAIWSLIGLCWSGVSCWRRRRGLVHRGVGPDRARMRHCTARAPWPDHVRARILEIIERGAPR